jgi:hypothetical protein
MLKLLGYVLLLVVMAIATEPTQAQLTGSNWTATFYNNTTLGGDPVASEVYPEGMYFNWDTGPALKADYNTPVPNVTSDHFSVRFTSTQTFPQGGTYVFTIYVDDGIRVFFDGALVLDQFNQNTTPDFRTYTFEHAISANQQVAMRVEYVEFTGSASFAFQWGLRTASPPIYIQTPYDGETVYGDYAPTFSWQDAGALSYVFRLWSDGGTLLLKVAAPAGPICNGEVCSIDSGAPPGRAGITLENDEYAWQVKAQGEIYKMKSAVIEFNIEYPGKPLNLSPDFGTTVTGSAPVLTWSDVAAANQYKVILTRVNNGAKIKVGWLPDSALGCDSGLCTLDPATMEPPLVIARGKYTWRVVARDIALKASLSKSVPAAFKFVPDARISPLPPPEAAEGFRAP